MLRLLQLVDVHWPAIEWGGPVRSVPMLAAALETTGAEVRIFTTTVRLTPDLPRLTSGPQRVFGREVTYFDVLGPHRYFFSPTLTAALVKTVRSVDAVLLTGVWTYPTLAGAQIARAFGVPYIVTPRGHLDPWALEQKGRKKRLYLAVAGRSVLENAALLHFTAEDERLQASRIVSGRPTCVVPNAIELEAFEEIGMARDTKQRHDVLILGRIHPMKGFDVLLPAMRDVIARDPRARLVIAGPDEAGYAAEVRRLAETLGISQNLVFAGLLDEKQRATVLAESALLVCPSYRENFGMSVAEAMATGLPVVVSRAVNISDQIEAYRAGLAVALRAEPLADAIWELLRSPEQRKRFGESGQRLVRENYGKAAVGKAMREAIDSVLVHRSSQ